MQPSIGLVAASNWNSLEVVKLAVAAATPVVIFALGYQVNRAARRIDAVQWVSRKLVEERLPLYREIAPSLNDLLCFFMLVGHFRAIDPPKAIAIKRDVDRTVHANLYLFTPKFMERYYAFMQTCFATFVGVGAEAKLRSSVSIQRAERRKWHDEWNALFTSEREATPAQDVYAAYMSLLSSEALLDEVLLDVERAQHGGRSDRPLSIVRRRS
jgi:hypothetical protein